MCPLPAAGDGLAGAGSPAGPNASFECLAREMATQFARQNEHSSPFYRTAWQTCEDSFVTSPSLLPARRSGCALSKRVQTTLIKPWTHCVGLDALQSASVSPVETKSMVSEWPLPKATLPARVMVILSPWRKDRSLLSYQPSERLKLGTSKVTNFNGVQFWSISLTNRTHPRLKSFVLVPSLTLTPHLLKLSARRAVTMPVSCSAPNQNVNNLLLLV